MKSSNKMLVNRPFSKKLDSRCVGGWFKAIMGLYLPMDRQAQAKHIRFLEKKPKIIMD